MKARAIDCRQRGIDWDAQPLGRVPDREIARRLGVHSSAVTQARARRGIAACPRRPVRAPGTEVIRRASSSKGKGGVLHALGLACLGVRAGDDVRIVYTHDSITITRADGDALIGKQDAERERDGCGPYPGADIDDVEVRS
jgi:hypothetical protein